MAALDVSRIEAILFDMGGTLRTREPDEASQRAAYARFVDMLALDCAPDGYWQDLERRYKSYSKWAQANLVESAEQEIWTQWMLPELPRDRVAPLAQELTLVWRQTKGRAVIKPDAAKTITELAERGYRLGLVSNTVSSIDIPSVLHEQGWDRYLKVVILSSTSAKRKPDPELFWEATRALQVEPACCAFVGDRLSRDVVGSRRAGFGLAILIESRSSLLGDEQGIAVRPDANIRQLSELLELFPPRT